MNSTVIIWIIIASIVFLALAIRIVSVWISSGHHPDRKSHHIFGLSREWEEFYAPGDTFKTNGYGAEDDDFDDM